jgi:hypothetical protein
MTDPNGLDVIDHATALIAAQLRWAQHVTEHRLIDPDAHPEYGRDLSPRAISRRAVGEILKAGMLVEPLTPAELDELYASKRMDAREAADRRRQNRHKGEPA